MKANEEFSIGDGEKGDGRNAADKLDREVRIKPLCEESRFDSSHVQWFDIESESPLTGKIWLIVCAIREDPGTNSEKKNFSEEGV